MKCGSKKGAGLGSGFTDAEYEKAGAKLCDKAKEVWDGVDMMVKVKEPLPEEYGYFRKDLLLFTYLHLAADRALTDAMLTSGMKGFAYETLDRAGREYSSFSADEPDCRKTQHPGGCEISGKDVRRIRVLLSGVPGTPKANIVIIGGGSVGTNACKIAVGMGANVTILDISLPRLAYLDDIFGARIQTLVSTDTNIENAVKDADLVIGSVLIPGKAAPKLMKRA